MSASRIAEALPSAPVQAVAIVVETSSSFVSRVQASLEPAVASVRAAVLDEQLPSVLVALLTPASMLALVFAIWRFTADIGWTAAFPIQDGFFSHWQVWMALAIALRFAASSLPRRVRASSKTS
jgi:hypothetical protein